MFRKRVRTIAIAGLDRRPAESGGRTDLLMLARIDFTERALRFVNLPRDLFVGIPSFGQNRLNAAYHLGAVAHPNDPHAGATLMRKTIARQFGIATDDHVVLDFDGFRRLVDAIGGVEVDVPRSIHDDFVGEWPGGAHFEAGRQWLDGESALRYARTRQADGAQWRSQRQLDLIAALYEKARSIRSPLQLLRTFRVARGCVETSLDLRQHLRLARMLLGKRQMTLTRFPETLLEQSWTEDGRWIYRGDPRRIAIFLRESLGMNRLGAS